MWFLVDSREYWACTFFAEMKDSFEILGFEHVAVHTFRVSDQENQLLISIRKRKTFRENFPCKNLVTNEYYRLKLQALKKETRKMMMFDFSR